MKKTAAYIITLVLALTMLAGCRNNNPAATPTPMGTPTHTPTSTPSATPTNSPEGTTKPTEKEEDDVLPKESDRADVETDEEAILPE